MVQASTYSKVILFTSSVGIALCVYAYLIEERKSHDASYKAVCDINERMSCSRVLTSQYAKGFGLVRHVLGEDSPLNVPNSIPGGALYALFALLSLVPRAWSAKIQIGLGILANIGSIYLASILYFVLQDFCVVCVSTYAINFINLLLAYLRLRALTPSKAGKQKGQQKSQKGQKNKQQNDKQKSDKQKNEKQKSPQVEKKKSEKQKSPQAEKQKQQNQQNGKVKNQQNEKAKNQQNDKQKSPKTPNSKKKN